MTCKALKADKSTKETYSRAKCIVRRKVHHARQAADNAVLENINPKSSEVFCLANQMRENADVVGDKPVRNDAGELSLSKKAKQKAWLKH